MSLKHSKATACDTDLSFSSGHTSIEMGTFCSKIFIPTQMTSYFAHWDEVQLHEDIKSNCV